MSVEYIISLRKKVCSTVKHDSGTQANSLWWECGRNGHLRKFGSALEASDEGSEGVIGLGIRLGRLGRRPGPCAASDYKTRNGNSMFVFTQSRKNA